MTRQQDNQSRSATDSSEMKTRSFHEVSTRAQLDWENVKLVGREHQTQTLISGLERITRPGAPAEAVLVHGYSGSGKSRLVRIVMEENAVEYDIMWARGKYMQSGGGADRPFSAISDAMNAIFDEICELSGSAEIFSVLRDTLTENELQVYGEVVPAIAKIGWSSSTGVAVEERLVGDAPLIRFMSIFRKVLRSLSSCNHPMVLFLDDLQWADNASRKLLDSILGDSDLKNLLLIGTIRDGDNATYEISNESVVSHQKLLCGNLTSAEVNQIVTAVTGRNLQDLSRVIFARTGGNPYFVRQFVTTIHIMGFLEFNQSSMSFECSADAVAERMPLSTDVVDLMTMTIGSLPRSPQLILVLASCLGGNMFSSDVLAKLVGSRELMGWFPKKFVTGSTQDKNGDAEKATISVAAQQITRVELEKSLKVLCDTGLIEWTNKKAVQYRLTHDRVQQTALSLLPTGNQGQRILFALGNVILELSKSQSSEDWMLYTATKLLVENRDVGITDPESLAMLCSKAALKASSQAAFKMGAKHADDGIKVLGKQGWDEHYDTCLDLTNLAAELHFSNGSFRKSKQRVESIQKRAKCVEDKTRAFNVLLMMLTPEDAVSEIVQGILDLGVSCPKSSSTVTIVSHLLRTKKMARKVNIADIQKLPQMTDRKKLAVTKLLGLLAAFAFEAGDENRVLTSCLHQFQMTLQHGISVSAPHAMAAYGVCLAHLGDIEQAYHYGKAAMSLVNRKGFEAEFAITSLPSFSMLWHLKRPLRECLTGLQQAFENGIKFGDSHYAMMSARFRGALGLFVGNYLQTFEIELKQACETMYEYKQQKHRTKILPWAQLVENLRGSFDSGRLLQGNFMDESKVIAKYETTKSIKARSVLTQIYYAKIILLYLRRDHEDAENARQKQAELPQEASTVFFKLFNALFISLNQYALAIKTGKRKYTHKAKPHLSTIKTFGKAGSPSVPPMIALLEAELCTFQKKRSSAIAFYNAALQGFKEQDMHLLEAVTYERMGLSTLEDDDESVSRMCLIQACDAYSKYGATMKVEQLHELYRTAI